MIGREKEINELADLYNGSKAELVAVYGRRRVGKTYLINQTFKNKFTFKHTAISPEDEENDSEILQIQLDSFYSSLIKFGLSECKKPTTWFEAFDLLEKLLIQKDDGTRQLVFLMNFHGLIQINLILYKLLNLFGIHLDVIEKI